MYELVSERHEPVDAWRDMFAAFAEDRSDPDRAWQDLLDGHRPGPTSESVEVASCARTTGTRRTSQTGSPPRSARS
jgi:hypothetical protein